ncbi:GntR family transcriptional regulator [Mesorhizobium sp. L-8-10]|uniref:GntR family transcriptional regulator n=1 Tax=Mesorhizobium sp. L-8-10 TaxID=2744523 RepID=UPI001925B948|nr:GntR family transcriptional regulator [Mesorhizobium sp. L-8-10]BCH29723.1 GntR family transcriptional regulator [Mesorhizobium sp. L-8-10]
MPALNVERKQFAYDRIARAIAAELTNSLWRSGDPLPSEIELASHFDVTRRTVRKALALIEKQGLIVKGRGRRTLYRGRVIDWPHDMVVDLPTAARRAGFRLSTRVLRIGEIGAGIGEAHALGVPLGEPLGEICRLRLFDGKAVVQQRSMLPLDIALQIPSVELERRSLYELIRRRSGAGDLFIADEHFAPSHATEQEARLSGIEEGRPVVRVTRVVGETGRAVEYSNAILLAPYFRF